jgi:AraC-like DNA-binding protein
MRPIAFWFALFTLLTIELQAGDTLFLRTIEMPYRVRNIDFDGRHLLIRCEDACYLYRNGQAEKLDLPVEGRYSWFSESYQNPKSIIYHTDYIFPEKAAPKRLVENILPGFYTHNITSVTIENSLFVSYRGVLLEYVTSSDISFTHIGESIRHVYNNDSINIVSTYTGIYMTKVDAFSDRKLKGTFYSNGELSVIQGHYYLNQDGLYLLKGDTSLKQVGYGVNNAAFRKLLVWNNQTVSLFNTRVTFYDLDTYTAGKTMAAGDEFNDIEVFDNNLFCCTSSGHVLRIHASGEKDTIPLKGVIHDLFVREDDIIASSDSGLFTINRQLEPAIVSNQLSALQTVAYGPNLFISTLNGLYLLRDGKYHTLIPNVEFNKRALSIYSNYLYAGSVDGLYTIQLTHFDSKILPTLSPYLIAVDPGPFPLSWIHGIGLLIALITGLVVYYIIQQKRAVPNNMLPAPIFSKEMVISAIREHDEITSVKALSEMLELSVVQLNRKLKPYGETPLSLMQQVKKEIAIEMQANGFSMDQIAKRTGYSRRYVREHFFN